MRKTILKWFWVWEFDKEEKWLNEMAAKGLVLVAVGCGRYTFEDCTSGEYNVRLEMLDNVPAHMESVQYIKFIEETGAEYLGGVFRWAYFRKKTDDGEFNLYSDNASRIKHLNRMLSLIGVIAMLNLVPALSNMSAYLQKNNTSILVIALIGLCVAGVCAFGFCRILLKRRELRKQQKWME